jgi:hypothetical protein
MELFRRDRRERFVKALPSAAAKLGLHGLLMVVGLFFLYHPMLRGELPGDAGDTLLNGYVLEHSWRWLTQTNYAGSYWSPPFFWPQPLTLAYSENLLGTAPLYWLLRLVWQPIAAYQLWILLVTSLTYVSMAAVLRRFGVGHLLAAFGGFAFAFGLPRAAQIGHEQLLPQMFAPWAVLAAWRFVERPAIGPLAGLLAATFAQLLAGMYLGWFLLLGLAVFAVLSVRRPHLEFLRRRWPAVIGLVAVWAGLVALLMWPYREANRGFHRDYAEVLALTPRPADWFGFGNDSAELQVFPGWVVLAVAACGLSHNRKRLLVATAIVLGLLATRIGDWTAWRAIFRWWPGGNGIRAVGRVVFTVELFALIGGLVAVDLLRRRTKFCRTIAALILIVGVAEQVPLRPTPSFAVVPWHQRVADLRSRLTPGTVAYVELAPDRPFWESQVTAMWAGLEANVPVVNGYSGRYPTGYPDWTRSMTDDELNEWTHGAAVVRIKD